MLVDSNLAAAERERCRELLVQLPLFAWLKAEQVQMLASQAASASYREGERIYARGSRSEGIYLVASGEVTFISGHENNPDEQDASTCVEGSFFGEMCLIEPRVRTADARASLPTKLFIIRIGVLEKLATRYPEQFAVLVTNLAREQARRLRQLNSKLAPTSGQGGTDR
ncbi:MAG: Crp/Fnr family transcriptional regulator [Candidatus Methylacidiphilales bacterium]|nr:Crp/Fnr family transcriptional regulator [Candidatus Methylacidiphilales bacterium]